MQVWGLSKMHVIHAVQEASAKYDHNLILTGTPRRVGKTTRSPLTFTLRVQDSSGPGAHRSASGRRTIRACWHAHRDVMTILFRMGATRLKSVIADYRSAENFRDIYRDTYYGTMQHLGHREQYGALCECGEGRA